MFQGTTKVVKVAVVVAGVAGLFLSSLVSDAEAVHKVYSPKVEKGEWGVEMRGHVDFDDDQSKDDEQKYKSAIGYGVTEWWKTELVYELEKEADSSRYVSEAVEFENIFQVTDDDAFIDFGIYLAYVLKTNGTKDKAEGKLLFEKRLGDFKHTANINLEKLLGNDAGEELEGGFAWKTKYYWKEFFRPGFEYHAGFGEFKEDLDFDEQTHQVGPVFYGEFEISESSKIEYEIGHLFGISEAAPDGSLKWLLEFEFEF
ncbi:MAG TPA: hypothetical protein VI749_07885 [Candidatus Omnitrophota bacterium]|nr:hypothetical protein [Candidatus Omnitrophota bacterium]